MRKELTPEVLVGIILANSRVEVAMSRVDWIRGRWEETRSDDAIDAWRAALLEQHQAWEDYWALHMEYFDPLSEQ